MSQHFACPFGSVASVWAWERLGAALVSVVWLGCVSGDALAVCAVSLGAEISASSVATLRG